MPVKLLWIVDIKLINIKCGVVGFLSIKNCFLTRWRVKIIICLLNVPLASTLSLEKIDGRVGSLPSYISAYPWTLSTRSFIPIWFLFVLLLQKRHTTILTKEKGMWLKSPTAVSTGHNLIPAWQSENKKQVQKTRTVIRMFLLQLDCYMIMKLELGQLQCFQLMSKSNTLIRKLTFMEHGTLTACLDIITTCMKLYRKHLQKALNTFKSFMIQSGFKVFYLLDKREHLQHSRWWTAISE